jgi:TonB-dependent starch-binding outer membrane protein SusC
MKKIIDLLGDRGFPPLKKLFRTMKITLLLILISAGFVFAGKTYSQTQMLNLKMGKTTVKEALLKIEDQSEFYFMFSSKIIDINREVVVNLENLRIDQVLTALFEGTDVGYTIKDRIIVLTTPEVLSETGFYAFQQNTVSGVVTDKTGAPLPGVTVVIKGTTTGTITGADGRYSVSGIPPAATLVFSFVGMRTQEVVVGSQTVISVSLQDETYGIEEVVAIGYGTVRKRDLTGSVSSVSGAKLKDIPVTSVSQAMVGRMPGVQVTKTEGSPDAEIKIRVRGGGSITQDNSPLYIVDGFPVENLNDIVPTDIESIDVLKDASSTAIYGARGANGVIIVTTKSGIEGESKISYNSYYGIKKIAKTMDLLDPYEYVFWQYESQPGSSIIERYFGDYRDYDLYKQMPGTDWQNEILGRIGTSYYNNVSISGGTRVAKYNLSLTHTDEEEIMLGSEYDRTNLTFRTDYNAKEWLKLELTTRLSNLNLSGAGTGRSASGETNSRLPHIIQFRPVEGLSSFIDTDTDDFEIANTYTINPLEQTNDDYRRLKTFSVNINGAANIKLSNYLTYRFELGYQASNNKTNRFYGLKTSNVRNYGEQPLAEIRNSDNTIYRIANTLTYSRRNFLPDQNITVMVGEELNSSVSEVIIVSSKYFPKYIDPQGALSMMNLGLPDPTVTLRNPPNKTSSFFGRLNYDYLGRYLLSATFRADGSSKFARGNRWGVFPSASVAWRLSDETFMKPYESWLTNLKLRLSYGQSGNNRIADDAWKKTFSVGSGSIYLEGNEETPTVYIYPESILSNPRLKWETTITRNAGLDFSLFRQKIDGTVEVYKNTTKDLLIRRAIPSSSGYSTQYQNIGQTSNRGLEVTLQTILVDRKDFLLSTSFNIGFNKNRIDDLGGVDQWEASSEWASADGPPSDYLVKKGGQVGLMYGYQTDGMYTFEDFDYDETSGTYTLKDNVANNSGLLAASSFGPGTLKFVNQNPGEGETPEERVSVDAANDRIVIGNANPKHTGGFNLTSQYKGFDLSVFFNWVYGNDIYNANKLNFTSRQSGRNYKNMLDIMNSDNRFTYVNKETGLVASTRSELEQINKNATLWSPLHSKVQLHSWAVEDGSFLRLNNVTFGYSLPQKIISKIGVSQLRLYFTGNNLWIWTNYSGFDPEVDTQRSTPLTPGVEWSAYPRSRSFNAGLNLTF